MTEVRFALALFALAAGCSGDDGTEGSSRALTYWQDIVPIFEAHCLHCHRAGGIAPFRLDDFDEVQARAASIERATRERTMPPWGVTSDGSCGQFEGSLALSDAQIQRIGTWVQDGVKEGTKGVVQLPPLPSLSSAMELTTPSLVPQIQGGYIAEADEYRCFDLTDQVAGTGFITGYEVVPGQPAIIHHVQVMLVDGEARSKADPAITNLARLQALDAETADRDGWPCFGMAGEGIDITAIPVNWAPGQGVVQFPNASGVALTPEQRVVAQVHYNLADPSQLGKADQTTVRLQIASQVENVGYFVLYDPLLYSLFDERPTTLAPGLSSSPFTWRETVERMGLGDIPELKLYGVMPHMHELGREYQMRVGTDETHMQCAADVRRWDFHWQRMYFYAQPLALGPRSQIEVTCDYDTSRVTEPVWPGWGTRNEMCLAALYFTAPASVLESLAHSPDAGLHTCDWRASLRMGCGS